MLRTTNGRRSRNWGSTGKHAARNISNPSCSTTGCSGISSLFFACFSSPLASTAFCTLFHFFSPDLGGANAFMMPTLMDFAVRRSGDASNTAVGDLHGLHGFGNGPRAGDYGNVGEQFRLFRTVLMRRTHFGVQPLLFFHSAQGTSIDVYPNVAKAGGVKKMDTSNTSRIASEVNPRHGF